MHRGAKAGDIISILADILRGRSLTKQEHKEVYQQTDPDIPVALASAATQTEETEPSAVDKSVDTGTAACSVADDSLHVNRFSLMSTSLPSKTLISLRRLLPRLGKRRRVGACAISETSPPLVTTMTLPC